MLILLMNMGAGSGKTYTMEGFRYFCNAASGKPEADVSTKNHEDLGIIPRVVVHLFQAIRDEARRKRRYVVRCSYVQMYNEQAYDLLNPGSFKGSWNQATPARKLGAGLRMRWSKQKEFYLENNFSYQCSNPEEAMQHFREGTKNKVCSELLGASIASVVNSL